MKIEKTLSILKPDLVRANKIGAVNARIENTGLRIIAIKMLHLNQAQAEGFYGEHKGKPFFPGLIDFMISGPLVVQILEGENAIRRYRELMGSTDPEQATEGSLRAEFATNMAQNAVHGSDSEASAEREIAYFFAEGEMFSG